jgi:hypothetical protein
MYLPGEAGSEPKFEIRLPKWQSEINGSGVREEIGNTVWSPEGGKGLGDQFHQAIITSDLKKAHEKR